MDKNYKIELDLNKIEQLGKLRENENIRFRSFLKGLDHEKIDRIVHRLNIEISNQIDCTKCGNCCKKLKPSINKDDLDRLSTCLKLPIHLVKEKYIEKDNLDGEEGFKNLPCSFLKDNKCTIYADRPDTCRSYPHLHKKDIISRLWGIIDNYSICPIVFNVFELLKIELRWK
jgi:Fe-S-cluster containining protein